MARISLNIPEKTHFICTLPVRISDINYGGHLSNDKLLSLLHEARVQFFGHMGYNETNVAGVASIMADVVIIYRNEGFYGDVLQIAMSAVDFSSAGFDLFYHITCPNRENIEIARAKTGIVFFDYNIRKVQRVPEVFKAQFDPNFMPQKTIIA